MTDQNETTVKRCAIYTRKSHEEGLEQEFNSLDQQRMSCENYVLSQQFNGWRIIEKRYDDGGFSGGNTDRPALQELLTDIRDGKVDVVVIYKIDRLSRSIFDFGSLQKTFDQHGVSFVSVTQQIDTSTSAGRMMLNILMTFAQYERETTADRIRDKMAASRRLGKWVGGTPAFGYRVENKHLVVVPEAAETLRFIFRRFVEVHSAKQVAMELNSQGRYNLHGRPWTTQLIYNQLKLRTCLGEVLYKGEVYPGEHEAIIDHGVWEEAARLRREADRNGVTGRMAKPSFKAPLKGILRCGHCDSAMCSAYTRKGNGKSYVYYTCKKNDKSAEHRCPISRIPGGEIEALVTREIGRLFQSETFRSILAEQEHLPMQALAGEFRENSGFWDRLYPTERYQLIRMLVNRVTVFEERVEIEFNTAGVAGLNEEIRNGRIQRDA